MELKKFYLIAFSLLLIFSADAMHLRKKDNFSHLKTQDLIDCEAEMQENNSEFWNLLGKLSCLDVCCSCLFVGALWVTNIQSQGQ